MLDAEVGRASGQAAERSEEAVVAMEAERERVLALGTPVEETGGEVGATRGEAEVPPRAADEAVDFEGTLYLECGNGGPSFVVHFERNQARLYLPEEGEVILGRLESASGVKYADGAHLLWSKGDAAIYEDADGQRYLCANNPGVAVWEDARRRGVYLRAVGDDWVLEVDPVMTVLITSGGINRYDAPTPDATGGAENPISFEASAPELRMSVDTTRERCREPGTGEVFDHHVRVSLNGAELEGCGRELR